MFTISRVICAKSVLKPSARSAVISGVLQALSSLLLLMKSPGCVCAEVVGDQMTRVGAVATKPAAESQHGKPPGLFCLQMGFPL